MIRVTEWEEGVNLIKELEAYSMDLNSRIRYAHWRRDGELPDIHAERIEIVDRAIYRMMGKRYEDKA